MTAEEVRKYLMLLGVFVNYLQQSVFLSSDGALSDDAWSHTLKTLRWIVGLASFRHYWETWGAPHADGFSALVDEILGEESGG